jgi:hypothetical protein
VVNLRPLMPPWVTPNGNAELRHPTYNQHFASALLSFFPQYSDAVINTMTMNIMAHWGVPVDPNMNFKQMVNWADTVEADVKRQKEELAKQRQQAARRK